MCMSDGELVLSVYRHGDYPGFLLHEMVCDAFLSHFVESSIPASAVAHLKVLDGFTVDNERYEVLFDQTQAENPAMYIRGPAGEILKESDCEAQPDVDECARIMRLIQCTGEFCEGKQCRVFASCVQPAALERAKEE